MYPCSGCLQCSDGCRRRCRRRSSEHAVDVRHLRTGHGSMIQLNSNTQHHPLSVAIELEHAPVARSHMVVAFCENERFSTLSVGFDRNASATSLKCKAVRTTSCPRQPSWSPLMVLMVPVEIGEVGGPTRQTSTHTSRATQLWRLSAQTRLRRQGSVQCCECEDCRGNCELSDCMDFG